MKTKIFLFVLIFSVLAFSQTSKFTKYFQYTNGSPMTGATIELLPEGNTYPTGAVELTEHSTRLGYYYSVSVPHGNYDVYIEGSLYESAMWVGDESVSDAANKFDPNGKLFGTSIEDETIKGQHIGDTTITDRNIKEDAITSYKILDETIQMIDLNPDVINAIVGGITPIADTGKVNTTSNDYLWGNYSFYGMMIGQSNSILSLQNSNYFRLPVSAPQSYLYGQVWYTTALNRGLFLRNNSSTNDTIPSLQLLRELGYLPYISSDTGKISTTGNDYVWGNVLFKGGIFLPTYTSLNSATKGQIFMYGNYFYGHWMDGEGNYVRFITDDDFADYPGSESINTLGTVTTGTWGASTIPINKGGTGATTATQAGNNILPSQAGNTGKALLTNGTNPYWGTVSGGTGSIANYEVIFQSSSQTEISLGNYTAYKLVVVDVVVAQGGNVLETISNGVEYQRVILIADQYGQDGLLVNQDGNIRLLNNNEINLDGNSSIELQYFPDEGWWQEVGFVRTDLYLPKSGGAVSGTVYSSPVTLTGIAPTADWNTSNKFYVPLGDDAVTVTFSNLVNGKDATVSVTNTTKDVEAINWASDIIWVGGTVPVHPEGKDKTALYKFERTNGVTIGYLVQTSTSSAVITRQLSVSSKDLGNLTLNASHSDEITLTALYNNVTVDSIKTSSRIAITEPESFTVEVGTPFVLNFTVDTSAVGSYDDEYFVFYTDATDETQDSIIITYNVICENQLTINAAIDFGTLSIEGDEQITLTNNGACDIEILSYDSLAYPYSLASIGNESLTGTITAGNSKTFLIKFSHTVSGTYTDTLWIFHTGSNSPDSIRVTGIWSQPSTVITDAWTNPGPGAGGWYRAIRYHSQNPNIVYMAGDLSGIDKSTDGGKTWTRKNSGIHNIRMEDIAVNPLNGDHVLTAGQGGVFQSYDAGENWHWRGGDFVTPVSTGYENINCLVGVNYHQADTNIVFAMSGYMHDQTGVIDRLWRSTDAGVTWDTTASDGLPGSADGTVTNEVARYFEAIGSNHADTAYACTNNGFYKSVDGGVNWTITGLNKKAYNAVVDPNDGDIVYVTVRGETINKTTDGGGIWKTTNAGTNWTPVAKTNNSTWTITTTFNELHFDPQNPTHLYVSADVSSIAPPIFKTTNGGTTWTQLGRTTYNDSLYDLYKKDYGLSWSFDVIGSNIIFTTPSVRSTDGGTNWEQTYTVKSASNTYTGTGEDLLCVEEIIVNPNNPNIIYAAILDNGFMKSTDGGYSWAIKFQKYYTPYGDTKDLWAMDIDKEDANIIYGAPSHIAHNGAVVAKSTDAGNTWNQISTSGAPGTTAKCLVVLPGGTTSTRTILMLTMSGLYRSTNSGVAWTFIDELGTPLNTDGRIRYSETNPNIIYVAWTGKTLYRSTDRGITFDKVNDTGNGGDGKISNPTDIIFEDGSTSTIYVAQYNTNGGLYKSTDGGINFSTSIFDEATCGLGFGILPNPQVYAVMKDKETDDLYVGGKHGGYMSPIWYGLGIWKSTDDGSSWTELTGMINKNVECITYDYSNNFLFAGTDGGGIQKYNTNAGTVAAPVIISFSLTDNSSTRTAEAIINYSNNAAVVNAYIFAGADTSDWQNSLTPMTTLSNSASHSLTNLDTTKYYVICKVINSVGSDISALDSIDFPESTVHDSVYASPSQSSDDAWYVAGYTSLTDTALYAGDVSLSNRHVAIRFTGITIPSGATIDSANLYIQSVKSSDVTTVNLIIKGEKTESPGTFVNIADIESRDDNLTDSSTTLSNVEAFISMGYYSWNVKSTIQQLTNLYSYDNGSMVLFIKDNSSSDNAARRFRSYDRGVGIPVLKIYFSY